MKKFGATLGAVITAGLFGCGGGGSGGDNMKIDNSQNQWVVSNATGYSGGNVIFGGQKIVGDWSAVRKIVVRGAGNSFASTSNYFVLGFRLDSQRYSEYWVQYQLVGGKVTSNAAWTPIGSYGVSKDGTTLTVDKYSSKKTYNIKNNAIASGGAACVVVLEVETDDEYELCKVPST